MKCARRERRELARSTFQSPSRLNAAPLTDSARVAKPREGDGGHVASLAWLLGCVCVHVYLCSYAENCTSHVPGVSLSMCFNKFDPSWVEVNQEDAVKPWKEPSYRSQGRKMQNQRGLKLHFSSSSFKFLKVRFSVCLPYFGRTESHLHILPFKKSTFVNSTREC